MKRIAAALFSLVLVITACGSDDAGTTAPGYDEDAYYATTTMVFPATTVPLAPGEDGAAGEAPGTEADPVSTLTATTLSRLIVFTATIEVEVEDISVATAQAQAALAGLGAMLFGQETTTGEYPRSVLTIKVPPENFDAALDRLAGVGELIGQTVFADDVTDRVVDMQSRIATAEASVLRLRALLETAPGIEEVVALESELLRRETDLEVLRGQLRTVEDQVALATIVLVLTEPAPESPEPAVEVVETVALGHEPEACPGREELEVDEGEPITVCFIVTNTGDTALTEIEVWDSGLGLEPDDAIVVEGDLAAPLLPGERLVLAYETEADFGRWASPAIAATAVDEEGDPLYIEVTEELEAAELTVIEDTSLPGFGDSLAAAWRGMQWLFGVAVVVAGAAVPFLWVPALAGAALWWQRRRTRDSD